MERLILAHSSRVKVRCGGKSRWQSRETAGHTVFAGRWQRERGAGVQLASFFSSSPGA